ncbi:MAG: 50S ribosomal protein L37ae [Candidatus Bathyarchaeia archaeon]
MPKRRRTTGSFGAKFGLAPRRRYSAIIESLKSSYECPKCGFRKVKRESVGVWSCSKCGYTFAGGAYQPFTEIGEASKRSEREALVSKVKGSPSPGGSSL